MHETAQRIVEIQRLLLGVPGSPNLSQKERENLTAEQRILWDRDYRGRGFEEIEHDCWLSKRDLYL